MAQDMKHSEGKEHSFAVKELDKFHDMLRPLFHESLEKGDFDAIRMGIDSLYQRAVAIEKSKLPKKFSGKKSQFQKSAKQLVAQLSFMKKNKSTMDNEKLKSKFEEMHNKFESLAELLNN